MHHINIDPISLMFSSNFNDTETAMGVIVSQKSKL
jgi:hypothetical protein